MATKTSTKTAKSTRSGSTRKAATRTAAKPAPKTARECIAQYDVLRFHVTVVTALSIVTCALVAALLFTLTN